MLSDAVLKIIQKKDGSPNALGKFYNTKTLKDLGNGDKLEINETPDYKPKVSLVDKMKEKIGKLRKNNFFDVIFFLFIKIKILNFLINIACQFTKI